jgi:superoxide dismutase
MVSNPSTASGEPSAKGASSVMIRPSRKAVTPSTPGWVRSASVAARMPDGELGAAVDEHFGSFDAFRKHFTAVALGIQGSGWSTMLATAEC